MHGKPKQLLIKVLLTRPRASEGFLQAMKSFKCWHWAVYMSEIKKRI